VIDRSLGDAERVEFFADPLIDLAHGKHDIARMELVCEFASVLPPV